MEIPVMYRRFTMLTLAFALAMGFAIPTRAADLRTEYGSRKVVRQVDYEFEEEVPETVIQCDDGGCDSCAGGNGCASCGCGLRIDAEYLLWFRRGSNVPVLATSSLAGTAANDNGILPGAPSVFGGSRLNRDAEPGGRITLGRFLDTANCWEAVGRFYALGDGSTRYFANETTYPSGNLAIPVDRVFANGTEQHDARVIAFNDGVTQTISGDLGINMTNEVLGGDVFLRKRWLQNDCFHLDVLVGYQFGRINDQLTIAGNTTAGFDWTDTFDTKNEYNALSVGLMGELTSGCWTMSFLTKFGFGDMDQTVAISGISTSALSPNSGLFAQNAINTGTFQQTKSAFSPEVNVNFAYSINDNIDLNFGASLIYWSSVLQAADHIDTGVDDRLIRDVPNPTPTPTRPTFQFRDQEFWVHGVNAGVTVHF
jgi:hypothetical protein